jgi:RNA polymerase II subunit A-like phosphatase
MPSLPREASSMETSADIADWDAELKDFLGDEDDSESDAGTNQSDTDDADSQPSSAKKRKRGEEGQSTDDESDSSQMGTSRLERRKRKALARTTSLASVSAVDDTQRSKAKAQTSAPQQDTPAGTKDDIVDDEDDLDLEAQMEAEMLRQAEEEGYA